MKFHALHFVVLACILAAGVYSFFALVGNQPAQLIIGIFTSVAYVLWGIMHHRLQNDLHPKIVVEYGLIGIVAILLLIIVMVS